MTSQDGPQYCHDGSAAEQHENYSELILGLTENNNDHDDGGIGDDNGVGAGSGSGRNTHGTSTRMMKEDNVNLSTPSIITSQPSSASAAAFAAITKKKKKKKKRKTKNSTTGAGMMTQPGARAETEEEAAALTQKERANRNSEGSRSSKTKKKRRTTRRETMKKKSPETFESTSARAPSSSLSAAAAAAQMPAASLPSVTNVRSPPITNTNAPATNGSKPNSVSATPLTHGATWASNDPMAHGDRLVNEIYKTKADHLLFSHQGNAANISNTSNANAHANPNHNHIPYGGLEAQIEASLHPTPHSSVETTPNGTARNDIPQQPQIGAVHVPGIDGTDTGSSTIMARMASAGFSLDSDSAINMPTQVDNASSTPVAAGVSTDALIEEIRNDILSAVTMATPATVGEAVIDSSDCDDEEAVSSHRPTRRRHRGVRDRIGHSTTASDKDSDDDDQSDSGSSRRRVFALVALAVICIIIIIIIVAITVVVVQSRDNGGGGSSSTNGDDEQRRTIPPTTSPVSSPTSPVSSPTSPVSSPTSPVSSPTSPIDSELENHHAEFLEWLKEFAIDPDALSDLESPQYRSFEWLATTAIDDATDIPATEDGPDSPTARGLLERYAMATLYYSMGGDGWSESTNWVTTAHVCDWEHAAPRDRAACIGDNIVRIRLFHNNLSGVIPREIVMLKSLESFTIPGSSVVWPSPDEPPGIPTFLGLLPQLSALDLSGIYLGGTLPTELGSLTLLEKIRVDSTGIRGTIPTQYDNFSSLEDLFFGDNSLSGQLPPELGKLPVIKEFNIKNNNFEGTIPPEYLSWPFPLTQINLSQNNFAKSAIEDTFCGPQMNTNAATRLEASCSITTCSCCTACS